MRGSTIRGVVVAAGVATTLGPAFAWADKTVDAGPPNRFTTTEITMDQGEKLSFHNGDTVAHDVTATVNGPDGKILFTSSRTDAGKTQFVEGSQYLTEGHYDFICSIHPSMKGQIHVTGNGTPAQRPTTSTSGSNVDRTKPRLRIRILSRTVTTARAGQAIKARITVSEPGHVELRAVARPKPGGPLVTIASRVLHRTSGTKNVLLKLTKAGRAALRRKQSLAVVILGRAIDRSGNMSTANYGRTLAP